MVFIPAAPTGAIATGVFWRMSVPIGACEMDVRTFTADVPSRIYLFDNCVVFIGVAPRIVIWIALF